MAEFESPYCPECDEAFTFPEPALGRRDFLRAAGTVAAAAALTGGALGAAAPQVRKPSPAEDLVRELYAGLKDEQKKKVVLPFDHGAAKDKRPTRMGMYNAPIGNVRIKDAYTPAQQDLVERIVKALSSGEEGYRQISRDGDWDASRSFDNCGAMIFGDPTPGKKFAFVFAGHHMTIRCDGDSEPGAAFGGPIYYGHSPNGYSKANIFSYQTNSVIAAYKALDEKQRDKATVKRGNPGEQAPSVRLRKKGEARPGIAFAELSRDQKTLIEKVMRDVLSPYRKEDVDEVMKVIKETGGMDKIQLAFYPDGSMKDTQPWHFWRLEGPGFVWNYRVLPHVHTFVNITSKTV
jgi:hypothetical protein